MKDYYSILGIARTASTIEIRRTYRRLAILYHPDKNPDPEAGELFKEINEAYDVLGDPEKRKLYDTRLENPFAELLQQEEQPRHRDPRYRKKPGTPPQYKTNTQLRQELIQEYLPYMRRILFFSIGFCALLGVDYILPFRKESGTINSVSYQVIRRSHTSDIVELDNGKQFKIHRDDESHFVASEKVTVFSTWVLGKSVKAEAQDGYTAKLPVTIYGNFIFAPLILLGVSVAGLLFQRKPEVIFNYGVASFFVLILNIVFLLIS